MCLGVKGSGGAEVAVGVCLVAVDHHVIGVVPSIHFTFHSQTGHTYLDANIHSNIIGWAKVSMSRREKVTG